MTIPPPGGMTPPRPRYWQVGAWHFDVDAGTLQGASGQRRLEPRLARLLEHFVTAPGELQPIERLLEVGWPDVVVTPNSVYEALAALRRLLGDSEQTPYLETLPRRGYRLVAAVSIATDGVATTAVPLAADRSSSLAVEPAVDLKRDTAAGASHADPVLVSPARWWPAPRGGLYAVLALLLLILLGVAAVALYRVSHRPPRRIAVVPLTDLQSAPEQRLGPGLGAELRRALARVPDVQVIDIGHPAVRRAAIDEVLAASDYVLSGTVTSVGERQWRLVLSLRETRSHTLVWESTAALATNSLAAAVTKAVAHIALAMRTTLPEPADGMVAGRPVVPAAYELFMLARASQDEYTVDGLQRELDRLNRALEFDPNFAMAYVARSYAQQNLSDVNNDRSLVDASAQDTERAIALAPERPEGYTARAHYRIVYRHDWVGGEADLREAFKRGPPNTSLLSGYSELQAALGHMDSAIVAIKSAIELDPFLGRAWLALALYQFSAGQPDEMEKTLQHVEHLGFSSEPIMQHRLRGFAQIQGGHPKQAEREFAKIPVIYSEMRAHGALMIAASQPSVRQQVAFTQQLAEFEREWGSQSPWDVAEILAVAGRREDALHWMEQTERLGDMSVVYLRMDPFLASLRNEPRYHALEQRLHMAP